MTATDWRTHATQANQQRFADAQARLDDGDYPPGDTGDRQQRDDQRFTDWYDQAVNAAAHDEFERQSEIDGFNRRWPEPADGARIEFEADRGTLYAAFRQDQPEHAEGSWYLYGTDERRTWKQIVAEHKIWPGPDVTLLTAKETT